MHAHAYKEAVKHGNDRRFGRREVAHPHAAQDDDRRDQAPRSLEQAGPEGRARQAAFQAAHVVAPGQPDGRNDQRDTGQDAGEHAGREQGGDGRLRHQYGIDNEGDGRRNQNIGGGAGGHNAGRIGFGIPGAGHGAYHHGTDRDGAGRARARYAAQEHGHGNRHQRQHAWAAAHDGNSKVDQAAGHARTVENRPDQHEHGNGQQRVLGQAGIEALRHRQQTEPLGVQIGHHDGQGAGNAQRHAYRHADDHQDDKHNEQGGNDHAWPRSKRRNMPAMRKDMANENTGIQIEYHHVGTPIAGEVSPQLYSSSAMRADSMVSNTKKARTRA